MTTKTLALPIDPGLLQAYFELTKPKVVLMLVFTAVVGMLLAVPGMVPWDVLIFGSLGIGLSAASAAAINHLVDQRIDAIMARTKRRPIPTGDVEPVQAMLFALVLGISGLALLAFTVNVLTALLTFGSLMGYAVIYTMFLKRATSQNIVIGGAAGAAPPILGWAAVTGEVGAGALVMFLIIFVWTPPHFWALAINRCRDYERAGLPMLPVTHGVEYTRLQILLYTILLIPVSALPYAVGMSGIAYLISALVLGAAFLRHAWILYSGRDEGEAMRTFFFSIHYLMLLFAALLIDHYLYLFIG